MRGGMIGKEAVVVACCLTSIPIYIYLHIYQDEDHGFCSVAGAGHYMVEGRVQGNYSTLVPHCMQRIRQRQLVHTLSREPEGYMGI